MSNYIFEGDKIKINAKDFEKLQRMYQNLNLTAELEQLDMELRDEGKKWWMVMNAKLNYRNKRAPAAQQSFNQGGIAYINNENRSTRDIPQEQLLSDRSWAE